MEPGEHRQETIRITNSGDEDVTLYASKQDFIAGDDTGTPRFIDSDEDIGFGLVDWIEMEQEHVTTPANTRQEVAFNIQLPENAEPGGHYGAVFYGPGSGDGQVWVQARLWVLILVQVDGEVEEKWELRDFQIWQAIDGGFMENEVFDSTDIVSFYLNFENQGNVHLQPEWKIHIYDKDDTRLTEIGSKDLISSDGAHIWETIVDYLPINEGGGNVLPQSDRSFYTQWEWFGYQVQNQVNFEDFQTHYNNKQRDRKLRQAAFYETIEQVPVQETFRAELELSYETRDGDTETFEKTQEFDIQYDSIEVVINPRVVGGGGVFVLIVFGWAGYYLLIGRKKMEAKLKAQLQKEMQQQNEASSKDTNDEQQKDID